MGGRVGERDGTDHRVNDGSHRTLSNRKSDLIGAPPTDCRHSVSGLFHSPHRGAFHLSLTVLVHYRLPRST